MIKQSILLAIFLFQFAAISAEDSLFNKNIWIESPYLSNGIVDECNFMFNFIKGKYKIFNDCYSDTIDKPIEIGNYKIKLDTIILTKRNIIQMPTVFPKNNEIKLIFKKINKDTIIVNNAKNIYKKTWIKSNKN
jgi:hypothetical protein